LKGKEEHVIISHAGGRRREEEATAVKQWLPVLIVCHLLITQHRMHSFSLSATWMFAFNASYCPAELRSASWEISNANNMIAYLCLPCLGICITLLFLL
jgi:hypothetical protein